MVSGMARPLRRLLLTALLLLLVGPAAPNACWYQTTGPYHGWTGLRAEATGRFRVERVDGVW